VVLDVEKAKSWLAKGATPTDTVEALLKSAGVITAQA
jgi:small subunit ribosomal protein S16